MPKLSIERVKAYRTQTFILTSGKRIRTVKEAVDFVVERGFVYFWPIKDIILPSLWVAVAGDRPVADAHDDPGHVTWGWKDSLLGSQKWYYAKVLRKKATMISMEVVPNFYALSENYGSLDEDYLTIYEQGRMTQEAKAVYEAILDHGPLDTPALRRVARLSSRENDSRFDRALATLQADFKILPIGVARTGGWRYAFIYDIVARHYPDIPEQARFIGERQARVTLLKHYILSLGAAQVRDVKLLFRWAAQDTEQAINDLVASQLIQRKLLMKDQNAEWIALSEQFLEQQD
jgi:hypothetical protein